MSERKLPPWTPSQERVANVVIRILSALNIWVYRISGGKIGGRFLRGAPVCLVTTTGRKSGQPRTAALWPRLVAMYRDYDDYQSRTDREIPVVVLDPAA
jgi:hypothetical protein